MATKYHHELTRDLSSFTPGDARIEIHLVVRREAGLTIPSNG